MELLTANTKAVLTARAEHALHSAKGEGRCWSIGGWGHRHGLRRHVDAPPRTASACWKSNSPKRPLESGRPTIPGPRAETNKLDYGQEEAAAKFGADPRIT